jgi:hypothetical protein
MTVPKKPKAKPKAKRKARKPDTRLNKTTLPFDPEVVTQDAQSGMPPDTLATALGFDLDSLDPEARAAFDKTYAKGLAQGVGLTFAGLSDAARDGDTKAIQMLFDYIGVKVKPPGEEGEDESLQPRRLLVEVSAFDK